MGVDEGNLQAIDVDVILENRPINIVHNLLVYSTIQYGTIIVIIVYIISVIEQYHNTIGALALVHKNAMTL